MTPPLPFRCAAILALLAAVIGCSPAPQAPATPRSKAKNSQPAAKTTSKKTQPALSDFPIAVLAPHGDAAAGKTVCAIATVNPLATDAGMAAFQAGGNAIDAAVAAALTLGVADGFNSGIGGGCFLLIRRADGTFAAIDGREIAAAAATHDMFIRDGKAVPALSQTGPLAVGVPGALAAYQLALERHGRKKLADLLLPAADIAENGFPIGPDFDARLRGVVNDLARFAGSRAIFLKGDRTPWPQGHVLKQPDLAKTYRAVAAHGIDWFYRGEFAQRVGEWMHDNGGILTAADFAAYRSVEREPLQTTYRGFTIVGFPPPSSGGVHVAQMLNILENFDLAKVHRDNPDQAIHIVAQAMKLAFADRAHWLGDPDFAHVPRGLIDKAYAKQLAATIDVEKATDVPGHGDPPGAADDFFTTKSALSQEKHTTHIAAADSDGNWVALTATVNTTFGSKVVVPGTGVVLNDEMDDFSAQPGVPNAFELIGSENNAVAPGKRPLSSMSPTIVLKGDQPLLTVGAAGGPKIITQVLQTLIRRLDFGQTLEESVGAPRIHHQWRPDEIWVEQRMDRATVAALEKLGHKTRMIDAGGVTQAIEVDAAGTLTAVRDPRVHGKAAAGHFASGH